MTAQPLQHLPHQGPAVLLQKVLELSPTRAQASCHLTDGHPYQTSAGIPSLLTIELFAQAAALVQSVTKTAEGPVSGGLLAAVPDLQIAQEFLPLGTVVVCVDAQGSFGALRKFAGRLTTEDGRELAHGEFLVHETPRP